MKIRSRKRCVWNTCHLTTRLLENTTSDLVRWKQHHTTGLFAIRRQSWWGGNSSTQLDCMKIRPRTQWSWLTWHTYENTTSDLVRWKNHHKTGLFENFQNLTSDLVQWKQHHTPEFLQIWRHAGEVETAPHNWIVWKYYLRPGEAETAPHNWIV
jgi:hypothetical protein